MTEFICASCEEVHEQIRKSSQVAGGGSYTFFECQGCGNRSDLDSSDARMVSRDRDRQVQQQDP